MNYNDVKSFQIGGFGTQGVTNQISYFLPSQGQWNGLTKVPHVECSNFGCATLRLVYSYISSEIMILVKTLLSLDFN